MAERDYADIMADTALELCVEKGWATVRVENGERVYSVDARGRAFIAFLADPDGGQEPGGDA